MEYHGVRHKQQNSEADIGPSIVEVAHTQDPGLSWLMVPTANALQLNVSDVHPRAF